MKKLRQKKIQKKKTKTKTKKKKKEEEKEEGRGKRERECRVRVDTLRKKPRARLSACKQIRRMIEASQR